jgi:Malectin domain
MKSVILLLLMATNVIAFEQIYAVNAGGEAHTDSDGIVYRGREGRNKNFNRFGTVLIGNVPVRDREVYHNYEFSLETDPPLRYDVPLKTDGLYLLIAKFFNGLDTKQNYMTLNNHINMLSNVHLAQLCGGKYNTCDKYFYFCVTGNNLHYQNQSTLIQNNEIHIEFNSLTERTFVSGLVLLKGALGERQKLISSNTNDFLDFDLKNMDPRCSKPTGKVQAQDELRADINCEESLKNITDLLEESRSSCKNTQLELERLQTQLNKSSNLLQKNMDSCCEMSWTNLTELLNPQVSQIYTEMKSLATKTNKNIEALQTDVHQLVEIQKRPEEKTLELETEIKTSIAQIHESNNQILTQQIQIHNQSTERMDIKLSELTTKTNQANIHFEKLQSDVQQLIEIQQKSEPRMTTSIETILQTSNEILTQQSHIQNESVKQLNTKLEYLQSELTTKTNKDNKNFDNLQSGVQQLAKVQQKSDQKTFEVQAEMKKSIERNQESSNQIFIQQMHIQNSMSDLASKSNQANKNIEALQASVQQLVDDNQKMRAEIKQMTEKMTSEVPAEEGSLKAVILEITSQLNDIREVVLTNAEAAQ